MASPPRAPGPPNDDIAIFDRRAVRAHRLRSALAEKGAGAGALLFAEVASRLGERLDAVRRDFPRALDLGCHGGAMARVLGRRAGAELLVHADLAPGYAAAARAAGGGLAIAADEEFLPFAPDSFDLVVSALALHWANDLPGALIQIARALKPDGLLLAAMLGGRTLSELREALLEAELEIEGGAGPRVSPFADVRDAGALLQRAGFALPVVDRDTITVAYDDALALMRDLRALGETNAVIRRRRAFTRRATLLRAAALYQERHAGPDGRIRATFDVIYLTGWKPDASQPKALRPGSARHRLADALKTDEIPAGDATPFPRTPKPTS
ncbi:MAG TPA: methyltransferase domain-containing protein [Alphaproteobacteria bacterium]